MAFLPKKMVQKKWIEFLEMLEQFSLAYEKEYNDFGWKVEVVSFHKDNGQAVIYIHLNKKFPWDEQMFCEFRLHIKDFHAQKSTIFCYCYGINGKTPAIETQLAGLSFMLGFVERTKKFNLSFTCGSPLRTVLQLFNFPQYGVYFTFRPDESNRVLLKEYKLLESIFLCGCGTTQAKMKISPGFVIRYTDDGLFDKLLFEYDHCGNHFIGISYTDDGLLFEYSFQNFRGTFRLVQESGLFFLEDSRFKYKMLLNEDTSIKTTYVEMKRFLEQIEKRSKTLSLFLSSMRTD